MTLGGGLRATDLMQRNGNGMWLGFSTLLTGEEITREGLWFIAR